MLDQSVPASLSTFAPSRTGDAGTHPLPDATALLYPFLSDYFCSPSPRRLSHTTHVLHLNALPFGSSRRVTVTPYSTISHTSHLPPLSPPNHPPRFFPQASSRRRVISRAEEGETLPEEKDRELMSADELEELRKREESDKLRAQEKFMKVSSGRALCAGCGYTYDPKDGDPEYPVARGTGFKDLPDDWICPVCGLPKKKFQEETKEIAGFEVNQGYGLGGNSMTGEQKSLLIFGSLFAFFLFFILGYFFE